MPKVKYDGDASSAVKAANDLAAAQKKIAGGADETAKAFGKADRESQRFLKAGETQLQKYNRGLLQTAELQKRGLLTQKQATSAAQNLRDKYERLDPAIRASVAAQNELAAAGKRMTQDLATPLETHNRKLLELGKSYRAGAITQQTFVRGAKQLKSELQQQDGTIDRLRQSEKAQADARKRQLVDLAKKNKIAATAAEDLKRKALAIVRENEQPLDRFRRKYKELNQVYRKGAISLDQKRRAAARLRTELRSAGDAGKGAFGSSALARLTAYATGLVSIGTAAGLARREIQAVREEEEKKTAAQLNVAQAEQNLRQNIFAFPPEDRERLLDAAPDIARDQKQRRAPILEALTATISGTGNVDFTIAAVDLAAQFTRDPEAIKAIAGGLGDVAFTAGLTDVKEALGFLTLTQAGARIENPIKTGEAVGKVLASFTAETAGSDAATGGALLAALSKGIADKDANLSRTAAINLIDRTKKFFNSDSISSQFNPEETDTFNEQLDLLLGDKALGREFLETASFRAASRGGIAKLILGDANVRGAFEKVRSQLSSSSNLVAAANEGIEFVNAGSLQGTARIEGGIANAVENFRLRPGADLSQESETALINLSAEATGTSKTGALANATFAAGVTFSNEEAIAFAERAIERQEIGPQELFFKRTDEEIETANSAAESLKQILQVLKENRVSPAIVGRAE